MGLVGIADQVSCLGLGVQGIDGEYPALEGTVHVDFLLQHRQPGNLVRLRVDVYLGQSGTGVAVEDGNQVDSVMATAFRAAQLRAIDSDNFSRGAGAAQSANASSCALGSTRWSKR